MSKGSRPRPIPIGIKQYHDNWDKIFNKPKKKRKKKDEQHTGN